MADKLLTPAEVAERLQVTRQTVWRWLREGELPAISLGGIYRVDPADLDAFLEGRKRTKKPND